MFKLKFLPATIGDAIWISYGSEAKTHHILVDGGTAGTRKHIKKEIKSLAEENRKIELIVVSHVDKDHINGIRTLLERKEVEFGIGDFWYNGFHHLPVPEEEEEEEEEEDESLGAKQGEALTAILVDQRVKWNKEFGGAAVVIPDHGNLPEFTLPGGMKITLLGPTNDALAKLRPVWIKEVTEADMTPGSVVPEDPPEDGDEQLGVADFLTKDDVAELAMMPCPGDGSKANGSSIALLAEFDGKRVLLAADAHADHLLDALNRLSPGALLDIDLFKISHHGSQGTTDRNLIEKVPCPHYVFSTNGAIYKHPDDETVSKVLTFGGNNLQLSFNYRKPTNTVWEEPSLQSDMQYTTVYPVAGEEGIEIEI